MNRRKLYRQTIACILLMTVITCGAEIRNETFMKYYGQAKKLLMEPMTAEDVREAGAFLSASLAEMPEKVVSAVSQVNNASLYGAPIDEKSDISVKQVHAAAGGMVESSGKNSDLGLYIKIRHEDAVTVYGNLSNIGVVESERVQRGEIIGSYDADCGKDFYYELQENL